MRCAPRRTRRPRPRKTGGAPGAADGYDARRRAPLADQWQDVGSAEELGRRPVQEIRVGGGTLALTCRDGVFGAISGACLHVGGPLGQGTLDGDHVVCPWHYWRF